MIAAPSLPAVEEAEQKTDFASDHPQLSPVLTSEISRLFSSGYSLLPLGGADGKQPIVSFKGRRRLPLSTVINRLAGAGSRAYGIRLSGILVVDVDTNTPEARDYVARRFGSSPCKTQTSRGFHLYFRHKGPKPPQVRSAGILIDFKSGANEYVVGPQSERPDGVVYWPEGRLTAPDLLPWFQDHEIPIGRWAPVPTSDAELYPKGVRRDAMKQHARALALSCASFDEASIKLLAFRDEKVAAPGDFPASEIEDLLRWFWDLREGGRLWGGRDSTVSVRRGAIDLLTRRGNGLATNLYMVLLSDHGHKPDAKFAIVPDGLRMCHRLRGGPPANLRCNRGSGRAWVANLPQPSARKSQSLPVSAGRWRKDGRRRERVFSDISIPRGQDLRACHGGAGGMNFEDQDASIAEEDRPSAVILDWHGPFAARVLSRLHEYTDRRQKIYQLGTVVEMRAAPTVRAGRPAIGPPPEHDSLDRTSPVKERKP